VGSRRDYCQTLQRKSQEPCLSQGPCLSIDNHCHRSSDAQQGVHQQSGCFAVRNSYTILEVRCHHGARLLDLTAIRSTLQILRPSLDLENLPLLIFVNKGIEVGTNALTLEIIADTCGAEIAKAATFIVSFLYSFITVVLTGNFEYSRVHHLLKKVGAIRLIDVTPLHDVFPQSSSVSRLLCRSHRSQKRRQPKLLLCSTSLISDGRSAFFILCNIM